MLPDALACERLGSSSVPMAMPELIKSLVLGANLLIMDEPTAALT